MSEAFRLSQQQLQLWRFEYSLMQTASQLVIALEGDDVNTQLLQDSLEQVLGLYECFATRFKRIEGVDTPLQVVEDLVVAWNSDHQWHELTSGQVSERLTQLRCEYQFGLDPDSPTVYADLIQTDDKQLLALHFHPMCLDGSSMSLLTEQLATCYRQNGEFELDEEALQYIDASEYHYELLESEEADDGRLFWQKQAFLAHYRQSLPLEYQQPLLDGQLLQTEVVELDSAEVSRLTALAAKFDTDVQSLLFGHFQALISRFVDSSDIVIGRVFDGRVDEELAEVLGLLSRVLPISAHIDKDTDLAGLLDSNAQRFDDIDTWQEVFDWPTLSQALPKHNQLRKQDMCFPLVFESLVVNGADKFTPVSVYAQSDHFKLKLNARLALDHHQLGLSLSYDSGYFDGKLVELLLGQYVALLEQGLTCLEQDKSLPIEQLVMLPKAQHDLIIEQFNQVGEAIPSHGNIVAMIQAQVAKTPQALAVECQTVKLSYQQMNDLANRYAQGLIAKGCVPGTFVGVYGSRSVEAVVALVAILKAGAVYVPLDPDYPTERIDYMIEHSGLLTVMVSEDLQSRFSEHHTDGSIDTLTLDLPHVADQVCANVDVDITPDMGAYLIYTSGSTGKPKGTLISHDALVYHSASVKQYFGLTADDRVLLFAPFNFDPSLEQTLPPLATGATVVVRPSETWDVSDIASKIESLGLTIVNFPTSYWHLLVKCWQQNHPQDQCATLRLVISGGDKMLPDAVKRWHEFGLTNVRLLNGYGPTEATVSASMGEDFTEALAKFNQLPIGRPLPNRRMYVLDQYMQPQPIATVGELYIGGKSLATGYLQEPEQTADKFIADPFVGGDSKMYKTGDRAFFDVDGQLYFLGRLDSQVKIRGYRIEVLEIERVLNQLLEISEAAVVVKTQGDDEDAKQLVACYVAQGGGDLDTVVKAYLASRLPEYMVPSQFIAMEQLPLSPSGKIDRNKLIEFVEHYQDDSRGHLAPNTETEKRLAVIWQQLLDIDQVGLNDNFMELGGHSLLTMKLSAVVREQFEVDFRLADVFAAPNLAALANLIDEASAGNAPTEVPLVAVDKSEPLPLSFAQEPLWFLDSLGQKTQYKLTGMLRLDEGLDVAIVTQAIDALIARHDSLRTRFIEVDGKPMQVIVPTSNIQLTQLDMGDFDEAQMLAQIETWNEQPFDLSQEPLLRVMLLQYADGRQVLVFTVHHIISDGLSTPILLRDFSKFYDGIAQGVALDEIADLAPLPVQYPDYALWQRETLSEPVVDKALDYWRDQLAGYQNLAIDYEHSRAKTLSGRGEHLAFAISDEIDAGVDAVCQKLNIGQTSCFIAMTYLMLKQYAQSPDFCLGMATATRDRVELEQVVGMLINTLVLRFKENQDELSLGEFLLAGQQTVRDAVINQLPFEKIVDGLHPGRAIGTNPFFQATVTYFESDKTLQLGGKTLTLESSENNSANFEMSFDFSRAPSGELTLFLEYSTDLFSRGFIEGMVETLLHMLQGLPDKLDTPLGQLSYIADVDSLDNIGRGPQLVDTTDTDLVSSIDAVLTSHAQQTAAAPAAKPAIVAHDQSLTYQQLAERVDAIAIQLQALGVTAGDFVAVALQRGANTTAAALGVIKAGAVYVPIDVNLPQARIEYILNDCCVSAVVVDEENSEAIAEVMPAQAQMVWLDDDGHFIDAAMGMSLQAVSIDNQSPAYMIYTSGSTGQPKGVLMPHGALFNLVQALAQKVGFDGDDRILAVATTSFDMSIPDIFMPVFYGATVIIAADDQVKNVEKLIELIDEQQPTVMQATPILWEMLFDKGWQNTSNTKMIAGGESPSAKLQQYIEQYQCTAFNGYGPTETCVYATMKQMVPQQRLSIGQPLANYQLYVLDGQLKRLPLGGLGQLYIGGPALAQGYFNQPELSEQAFVNNPYGDGLLYATGDLVHWQNIAGQMELVYDGRADEQVKLRGFRIELSEIESAMQLQAGIAQVAVIVVKNADDADQLVAFYVATDKPLETQAMRQQLSAQLPNYMVPTRFVALDTLPLTSNNKIDKRALQDIEIPQEQGAESAAQDDDKVSGTMTTLLQIWQELFGHEQIGFEDNFFDLGGHSLLFVELQLRIFELMGADVSLDQLFNYPDLPDMAAIIDAAVANPDASIDADKTPAQARLSFNQQGLWLSDRVADGSSSYNMLFALRIKTAIDKDIVLKALQQLEERHQVLRTGIDYVDGTALQQIKAVSLTELEQLQYSGLTAEQADEKLQQLLDAQAEYQFDLSAGQLWQVQLVTFADDHHVLVLNLHHICADGWSMRILVQEFSEIYQALSQGQPPQLAPLPVQYIDFAHWQRQQIDDGHFDKHLDYWLEHLQGCQGVTPLPLDRQRDNSVEPQAMGIAVQMAADKCQGLRDYAKAHNCSLFNLMLATYQLTLALQSGENDVIIGTDVANRSRGELENLVGFFTNQLPVRTTIDWSMSAGDYLAAMTEHCTEILGHQDVPFELLLDKLNVERVSGLMPLFQSKFYMDVVPAEIYSTADSSLVLEPVAIDQVAYRSDLSLGLTDDGQQLRGNWVYNGALFDEGTIKQLVARFEALTAALIANPRQSLKQITDELVSDEQAQLAKAQQDLMASKMKSFGRRSRKPS